MRKKRGTSSQNNALKSLAGGKAVAEDLARRHMADLLRGLQARFKEKSKLQREASKYLSKIRKPMAKADSKEIGRAVDGQRAMAAKLAKRKLIVPRTSLEVGGVLAGSYSVRLAPPYDYASTQPYTSNPEETASANRFAGQMGCSASTFEVEGSSFLGAQASIGSFFFPPFGPGILQARANPALTFSWLVENVQTDGFVGLPASLGLLSLGIIGYRGTQIGPSSSQLVSLWGEDIDLELGEFGVKFDFESIGNNPLATQLDVDTDHFYLVYVNCFCLAQANGWQATRTLASASLSVTLPSISLGLQLVPVLSEA